ncbi:MAG TPA: NAD-dependent epimerase/dehydratase family protein [Acidimicrobiales bacterium]|nr:NAD-dependent epimerase/dehydratase family protein [Acidimicrobiales bacterium]
MRVVVAGGAGFLGSHLCDALLARGDEVVALDNLSTGSMENLAAAQAMPSFTLHERDVSVRADVDGAVDAVMNLASPASPPTYLSLPLETLAAGAEGTRRLLELAERSSARFVQASSSEVYGDPAVHPQREDYWGNVNPVGPRSVYDESKRFGEALTIAHHRALGTDVGIARIFNTYGPRLTPGDGRVVSTFIVQALHGEPLTVFGDGTQTRSPCFVDDLVRGLIALLDHDVVGPVNLGNPEELTVLEVAHRVIAATGSESSIVHKDLPVDDPARRRPDVSLAASLLDWAPRVGFDEGLATTVAHFRSITR